ncbi:MAG: phosphoribosylglycinamide formyltransferase [Clostridiales bacterium]|nr:phosphoribosylglycinamide formyltransferase [Clostridiales bacterium]MDY6116769.1 phosphoribosylglycinamide formyltransferase [Anaerovoracaceae bacterium]
MLNTNSLGSKIQSETVRIAVLVSGGGTNLQALIDNEATGKLSPCSIELVVSNNSGVFALKRAAEAGIESFVTSNEEELLRITDEHKIDFLVLAGYLKILSKDFITKFNKPIINIHPSLIPSFCGKGCYGLHVHEKALEYGVKVSGATVHYVNEIPDGGEIILQKAVDVMPDDTPEKLQRRIMEQAEWVLLPKACVKVGEDILSKKLKGARI